MNLLLLTTSGKPDRLCPFAAFAEVGGCTCNVLISRAEHKDTSHHSCTVLRRLEMAGDVLLLTSAASE